MPTQTNTQNPLDFTPIQIVSHAQELFLYAQALVIDGTDQELKSFFAGVSMAWQKIFRTLELIVEHNPDSTDTIYYSLALNTLEASISLVLSKDPSLESQQSH
jgi:hypothetical protein